MADYLRSLNVDGVQRSCTLVTPAFYSPVVPLPLVICFHGGGSTPMQVRLMSKFQQVANQRRFLLAFPAGTNRNPAVTDSLYWNDGRPYLDGTPNETDDLGFFDAMLADIQALFNVDSRYVFAAGYSNGAYFCDRLAQQRSSVITAIGCVAGHRGPAELFEPPARAISKIQYSGMLDNYAPYNGGLPMGEPMFYSVSEPAAVTAAAWAAHNGCPNTPAVTQLGAHAYQHRYWPGTNNTEVAFVTLTNGGHTWPGGNPLFPLLLGPTNYEVFAADDMYEFFIRQQPLT